MSTAHFHLPSLTFFFTTSLTCLFTFSLKKMPLSDNAKKNIIVWFSCFYVFTTGSILFGWPAIYPIIVDEGQYDELCVSNSSSASGMSEFFNSSSAVSSGLSTSKSEDLLCSEQKVRLNLVFTLGYLFVGFSNLCGILTDRIGPKLSNMLGTSVKKLLLRFTLYYLIIIIYLLVLNIFGVLFILNRA